MTSPSMTRLQSEYGQVPSPRDTVPGDRGSRSYAVRGLLRDRRNNRRGSGGQPSETYILSSPDAVGVSARRFVIFGPAYTTVDRLIGPDGPGEVRAETRVPNPRRYSTRTSRTYASPTTSLNGLFRPSQEPDHAPPRGTEAEDDRSLPTRPRRISRCPRPLRHHRRHRRAGKSTLVGMPADPIPPARPSGRLHPRAGRVAFRGENSYPHPRTRRLGVGTAKSHPSAPSRWPGPTASRPASDRQWRRLPQSRGRSWSAHGDVHPRAGTSRWDGWTSINRSWNQRRTSRPVRTPSSGCAPSRSPVCTAS